MHALETLSPRATQRIIKIRRDYNTWVANETMEDYALRFTPRSFRKWSEFRVANTALGAVSFLALEAIGGSIALSYGFTNAFWAIVVVGLIVFLTGLPISYYAAKYGVDMDLLTRGAGFGYIGSTLTSLIYASFTFIFFALEAAIMALALELYLAIPLSLGYLISSLVIIPLVIHGVTLISRLQAWTQPIWLLLLALPFVFVALKDPEAFSRFTTFNGRAEDGGGFNLLLFGAAATVAFSLIAQIGEQVDFLRFLPEKRKENRLRWWVSMLAAGPGWILPGMAKMLGGAFLAFLALQHEISIDKAVEPTQMYLVGFRYVFSSTEWALAATALFVIVSQIKINVTNAYAGSLAWSNFFARVTHSHPGRVVWLVFNVAIAMALMQLGVFTALEKVLGLYSNVAIAWVGALVADLVVNKPLGLSPKRIEFKRAYLYDINPVGVGSMLIASGISIAAFTGVFGTLAQALAPFIALGVAFCCAPLIAVLTRGRYYIARNPPAQTDGTAARRCVVCENAFEPEDMAACPAYGGAICSLCCSLDARCQDRCKERSRLSDQLAAVLKRILPHRLSLETHTRFGHYLLVLGLITGALGGMLALIYYQEATSLTGLQATLAPVLKAFLLKVFVVLVLVAAVGAWWLVLANASRFVAQEESNRQTHLLMREIEAHRQTDLQLQRAKEVAEAANSAKSRYLIGMSHELRTPLNSILGYAQILQKDSTIPPSRRDAIDVIRRSGEHLLGLIDGLLDIARIEAGKMRLNQTEVFLPELLDQIVKMFRPQAQDKGLAFRFEVEGRLPRVVHADSGRLRQILINLLSNALKFTNSGRVSLRVSYRREMARFVIEDTGLGIAAEDLTRIFLPFERGAETTQQGEGGIGLGLTISRMLTELMGGELTVSSAPGRGSLFEVRVYLPEVASPKTEPAVEHDAMVYAGDARRALVVDDQASQRQTLATLLGTLGFEVAQAQSGEACLRMAATHVPDVVLLDITMPGMSGWETCRRLRAQGLADLPVFMVSANAFEHSEKRVASGCTDFITKPVLLDELMDKLQTHLRLRWVRGADAAQSDVSLPDQPAQRVAAADWSVLRDLGRIGYVRGIQDKLDEIERKDPTLAPLLAGLRKPVARFRLDEYLRRLEQLGREDVRER